MVMTARISQSSAYQPPMTTTVALGVLFDSAHNVLEQKMGSASKSLFSRRAFDIRALDIYLDPSTGKWIDFP